MRVFDLREDPDASLDAVVARNTLIYVDDPVATLAEFRRVLKPGGIAHAIEGDWRLTAVEPVGTTEWRAVIEAAREAKVPVLVDPKGTDFTRYRGATLVTPNRKEAVGSVESACRLAKL